MPPVFAMSSAAPATTPPVFGILQVSFFLQRPLILWLVVTTQDSHDICSLYTSPHCSSMGLVKYSNTSIPMASINPNKNATKILFTFFSMLSSQFVEYFQFMFLN